jgi:hypothetical protein
MKRTRRPASASGSDTRGVDAAAHIPRIRATLAVMDSARLGEDGREANTERQNGHTDCHGQGGKPNDGVAVHHASQNLAAPKVINLIMVRLRVPFQVERPAPHPITGCGQGGVAPQRAASEEWPRRGRRRSQDGKCRVCPVYGHLQVPLRPCSEHLSGLCWCSRSGVSKQHTAVGSYQRPGA